MDPLITRDEMALAMRIVISCEGQPRQRRLNVAMGMIDAYVEGRILMALDLNAQNPDPASSLPEPHRGRRC